MKRSLLITILPALLVSWLFFLALGHRRDYLGHYAAGYGATLVALAIALASLPARAFPQAASWAVTAGTIVCIGLGTITEATIFRLAKFDEIDYCNQNLGAILAGLATMHASAQAKPPDNTLRSSIVVGALFLAAGCYFALT